MSTSKESFSRHYRSITRKEKTNVHSQSHHTPTSALQALTEQHLLYSPQQPSGVLISGTATPPFAKPLEKNVAVVGKSSHHNFCLEVFLFRKFVLEMNCFRTLELILSDADMFTILMLFILYIHSFFMLRMIDDYE